LAILDRVAAGRLRDVRPPAAGRRPPCGARPGAPAMSVVLETRALTKRFGGLLATNNVSFQLERGARQALIGPNGAGKTTFVNLLTGVLAPSAGEVMLLGEAVTSLRAEARVRRGLVRTFQINQLFADLTPLETLALAIGERLQQGQDWGRRVGAL